MNLRKISSGAWAVLFLIAGMFVFFATDISAANSWDQCNDGSTVVRCETYDCPQGDTNKDGECTLDDTGARISDIRNDSLCANPLSGCGEVHYYPAQSSQSCQVRVSETNSSCDLYQTNPQSIATASSDQSAATASTGLICSNLAVTPTQGKSPLSVNMKITALGSASDIDNYSFKITGPNQAASGEVEQSSNILSQASHNS